MSVVVTAVCAETQGEAFAENDGDSYSILPGIVAETDTARSGSGLGSITRYYHHSGELPDGWTIDKTEAYNGFEFVDVYRVKDGKGAGVGPERVYKMLRDQ